MLGKRCLNSDTGADGNLVVGEELDELLREKKGVSIRATKVSGCQDITYTSAIGIS
jgi:hypothetical protein